MWKDIIDEDLIVINPQVKNKDELFEGMVNHVYERDYLKNQKRFLLALKKREKISNTELIQGVALPHARSDLVEKMFLCLIIIKDGIDFGNPDMGPVQIIFFFGCTEAQNKEYLQLLAKSSRLLKNDDFRKNLLTCNSPKEVLDILMKYDDEEQSTEQDGHHLLVLTLQDTDNVPEVLEAMVEIGITNSSIVDSTSMARKMAYE
ncbi:MAG: PTS sugar transporter subunit IIA, partial [Candidatus Cloacimonetes bacterium]|nr:PTS sugar transporter subunit IIA [Candidatus Cloacimonadota bacterium]